MCYLNGLISLVLGSIQKPYAKSDSKIDPEVTAGDKGRSKIASFDGARLAG